MQKKRNKNKRKAFTPASGVIIGLTGGIGSGKSFLLKSFEKLGFVIFDTDKEVHNLMLRGKEGYKKIARILPKVVDFRSVNRAKLSKLIIDHPQNLKRIEKILHPLVRRAQEEFAFRNRNRSIVFEVPLLFENKREPYYDYVVSAIVSPQVQKKRVMTRKGMTQEKFDAIISKQVSNLVRTKKADFIIDTNGSKKATFNQIKDLIQNV